VPKSLVPKSRVPNTRPTAAARSCSAPPHTLGRLGVGRVGPRIRPTAAACSGTPTRRDPHGRCMARFIWAIFRAPAGGSLRISCTPRQESKGSGSKGSVRLFPLKGELRTEIKRRGLVFARVHDRPPPDAAFASHGGWVLHHKTPLPGFQRRKSFPNQRNLRAWERPNAPIDPWGCRMLAAHPTQLSTCTNSARSSTRNTPPEHPDAGSCWLSSAPALLSARLLDRGKATVEASL
jgi:hypothetical protein